MGEAALEFVQRFDLQVVLRAFEKELCALVAVQPQADPERAAAIPCAKLD
jgi:hypothetical protein